MCRIIMCGSFKGGVGKTVTAFNLTYSLAELGKKVLAVDFDSQANLTTCFGVEDVEALPVTIGHLMMDEIDDEELPEASEYIHSRKGVDFIPSSMMLSAVDSKACKNRRMLYVLMEGELFPMVLSLPTGSLKEFTKYLKRQLSKGRKLNQIVTKISLKKATNGSGIAFSQAVFSFERVLNEEEKAAIAVITDSVKTYAANLTMSALAEGNEDTPFVDAETGEVIEPLKK